MIVPNGLLLFFALHFPSVSPRLVIRRKFSLFFFLIKHCDMTFFSGNSCCCFSADHFSISQQINITCFTFARHIFRIADGEVKSAINFIWMQINCRGRNPKKVAQIVFAFFLFSASESNKNEWNAECNKKKRRRRVEWQKDLERGVIIIYSHVPYLPEHFNIAQESHLH